MKALYGFVEHKDRGKKDFQMEVIRKFCKETYPLEEFKEYYDDCTRGELMKLLRDADKGLFDKVIVLSPDKLSSYDEEYEKLMRFFQERKIEVQYVIN